MVIGSRLELSVPPVKALETVPSLDEVALAGGEPIPVDQANDRTGPAGVEGAPISPNGGSF